MSNVFATLLKIAPAIVLSLTSVSVDAKSLITPTTSRDSVTMQTGCSSKTMKTDTNIKKTSATQRPGRTGRAIR